MSPFSFGSVEMIKEATKYIDTFKENRVTIEKQEPKQWKSKDEMVTLYNRWLEKWK